MTRKSKVKTAIAATVYASLAFVAVIGLTGVGTSTAQPASSDVIAHLEAEVEACQAKLDSATTSVQRTRANNCLSDARRALEWINRPTTPPTTTTVPPTSTTVPPTTTPPAQDAFPNPINSGVPQFWTPAQTRSTSLRISTAGAVVEDVLLTNGASITVDAANVTIRRVVLQGGTINNVPGSVCRNGLRVERSSFFAPETTGSNDQPVIRQGGYTADGVKIVGYAEGLRVGGKGTYACGPTIIRNSYINIQSPDVCGDWHGDGFQGYDGPALTINNVTVDFQERSGCGGTAPVFYPRNQGNTSLNVDGLLVMGGGFAFRDGMPGSIRNLNVVDGSYGYGPIDVRCSVITSWDAKLVRINSDYQVTSVVRQLPCNTETGT